MRRSVSPPELFFDLVFVFAVGRLAEHLLAKLSRRGAAETAVTLVAVLSRWALTSFDATFLNVGLPRTRWLVLTVTGPGLYTDARIPHAFADRPWAFAVPPATVPLLTDVTAAATALTAVLRRHYRRVTARTAVSGPRPAWWAAAATLDMLGA
ncbi:low temperature requirement protein A [Kitasatospora griseola]|uniref:low temperature requirement protein A n=1 Tax=Kitasatospora griseola TaxID=2064 RepID=UPI003855FC24